MKSTRRKNHSLNSPVNSIIRSKAVEDAFSRFIEYHPAARLSRNLRRMLLAYMMTDGACESFYLKDLLHDLEGLFDLLDVVEREETG